MQSDHETIMPLRLLEELIVWKTQEQEHSMMVRSLLPELEPSYVQVLREWENVFAKTKEQAQLIRNTLLTASARYTQVYWPPLLAALVKHSQLQSEEFTKQLQLLPEYSSAIPQSPNSNAIFAYMERQRGYYSGIQEQLESSGILKVLRAYREYEDTPDGYGGPEPADHSSRPDGSSLQDDPSTRPASTWSNPTGEHPAAANIAQEAKPVPIGGHELPPLPYSYKALEPYIDEKTMRIHHDKHHKSYVDGLNTAESKLAEARKTGSFDLVKHWERELAFNGAGHYLHTLFWNNMSPKGGGKPQGELLDELQRSFGSYEAFKKQFTEAANKVEGGGWAILVWSPRSHRLEVLTAEKHQNLSQWDVIPLLALDVWEHAYYLKHQNDRPAYTKDWWNVVNWPYVEDRFSQAKALKWVPY